MRGPPGVEARCPGNTRTGIRRAARPPGHSYRRSGRRSSPARTTRRKARAEGANLVGDAGPSRPAVLRAADRPRLAERRERPALGGCRPFGQLRVCCDNRISPISPPVAPSPPPPPERPIGSPCMCGCAIALGTCQEVPQSSHVLSYSCASPGMCILSPPASPHVLRDTRAIGVRIARNCGMSRSADRPNRRPGEFRGTLLGQQPLRAEARRGRRQGMPNQVTGIITVGEFYTLAAGGQIIFT
jgi:hypothetical protein